jgi:hypothetical protein
MGFLAPWFLAGAAAVGLPIYLHLLRRHTANPQPVSSLMFFEQRTQSSIRHRRLRYLLLLSLRVALLLLLALVFADPFIHWPAASVRSDDLLLFVIDNSFSMRAGTRLDDAKREALSALSAKSAGERGQVIALGSQVHVLTEPIEDPGSLSAAIESVEAGDTRGSFGELARSVRAIAENVHTPVKLHLFSDLQRSNMPSTFSEMALPPTATLLLHPVARAATPNWTVESVSAPGRVGDPKKARVEAVITGFHTPAATRRVSLVVNGNSLAAKNVDVPANGRATVVFESLDVPYGFSKCEVKIDSADALSADDASIFAVERSDPERVLFVHEANDSRSPLYFGAALGAAAESAFALESMSVVQAATLDPRKYALVVLADAGSLPSSFENDLQRYVRRGGSIFLAAGVSAAQRSRLPVVGDAIGGSRNYARSGERFLVAGQVDASYPSVENTSHLAGVKFYFAALVDAANSRVIARLTDQTPLLMEKKMGEGRVLIFASGLDNVTNDFPLRSAFVPFVDRTALYLSGTERSSGSRVVDSFLELRTAKEQAVGVKVIDPEGRRPLSLREATSAQSYQLTRAGFYELQLANGRREVIGVNPDRRESDLDVIQDDVLALWRGSHREVPQRAAREGSSDAKSKPFAMWWYLMILVAAAAAAESLVASRHMARQEETR